MNSVVLVAAVLLLILLVAIAFGWRARHDLEEAYNDGVTEGYWHGFNVGFQAGERSEGNEVNSESGPDER